MSFNKMVDTFKSFEELKAFAEAQYKTIIDLSKKITRIEEDKKHLEKLLQDSVPLLPGPKLDLVTNITDEEFICRTQLSLLKGISQDRELTLEETKKVDTYTKLLQTIINPGKKQPESKVKSIETDKLIALLENEANDGNPTK